MEDNPMYGKLHAFRFNAAQAIACCNGYILLQLRYRKQHCFNVGAISIAKIDTLQVYGKEFVH
jgi:hypothetical protein